MDNMTTNFSHASSKMSAANFDCFCDSCKVQQQRGVVSGVGTMMTTSTATGTPSPPSSTSPSAGFQHYRQHHQHFGASCSMQPMMMGNCQTAMSITAQGALERNSGNNMTECVVVPSSEHVAEIVGKQGCKIKSLRDKTNTYIKTPMRGEEPVFVITGRLEDVDIAKCEIVQAAEHFTQIRAQRRLQPPAVPGQVTERMQVPLRLVGLIVGPKGQTIKRIQQDTNTYIVTPGREKEPVFDITGPKDGVDKARELIAEHILNRTGNTHEELLRQQAEQGIIARPRSRSVDAEMANFDIGCWNVDPEPESDGDGSDSGMVLQNNNGVPTANGHHPHATRFASLSSASPHYAALMQHQQQRSNTNGHAINGYGGMMSNGGTLLAHNRTLCGGYPGNNANGDLCMQKQPQQVSPTTNGMPPLSAFNVNNSKMRSASFSTAAMGGFHPTAGSPPDGAMLHNHQQQLHRAAIAAAANAGCRRSLQYSSMADAFGDRGTVLVNGTGNNNSCLHHQSNCVGSNGVDQHYGNSTSTFYGMRRLNSEPYGDVGGLRVVEEQHESSRNGTARPSHYHQLNQFYQQRGGGEPAPTTPTNLTCGTLAANSFSAGIWSSNAAPLGKAGSYSTPAAPLSAGMDKMMSMMTLSDADNDAGFVGSGGSNGKATSTSVSSSTSSGEPSSIWGSGPASSATSYAATNGASHAFIF